MLAPLLLLLLPFLTSACFCPSCGCSCCSGYNNYYSQNSGGYQNNGAVGYGQPYTVFFNQPIPAGPGVEVRAPLASQQAPSQFLPPLQSPPQFPPQQYAQPQYPPPQQAPQLVQPRVTYVQAPQITVPAQQPAQPANNYELPIVQKPNVGFQPSRQVETLNRRPNVVSGPAETTVAPYTGTTKIVPAKQGKNKDYEYYYVYYDEDGKKVPGKSTAKPLHDGSIRQRATTAAPQNSIDEYDFEDTKASVEGQIPVTTRAPILNVNPITVTVATPKTTEFVEPEGEVHLIDEITTIPTIPVPVQTTPAAREPQPVQEEEDSDGDAIYEDELGGTTNKATVTTTKGQVVTFETLAPTTTKLTTTSVPARATVTTTAATTTTGDSKNYEYEEYEVEEIQLINENGVTETVTRIITTTKAPPKQ